MPFSIRTKIYWLPGVCPSLKRNTFGESIWERERKRERERDGCKLLQGWSTALCSTGYGRGLQRGYGDTKQSSYDKWDEQLFFCCLLQCSWHLHPFPVLHLPPLQVPFLLLIHWVSHQTLNFSCELWPPKTVFFLFICRSRGPPLTFSLLLKFFLLGLLG